MQAENSSRLDPLNAPGSSQMAERHAKINWQRQRRRWIEMRLRFLGEVRRSDVIKQFQVNEITASRDLSEYRKAYPGNIGAADDGKSYRRPPTFTPRFDFTAREVLEVLTTGHFLDTSGTTGPALQSLLPPALHEPNLDVLAALTEGIHRGLVVTIDYCSLTSGDKTRDIVPFVLANDGLRWHVRAYDRDRKAFIDFVLTRIYAARLTAEPAREDETAEQDLQWGRRVELQLVPKPGIKYAKAIEMEYNMTEGMLKLRVPAALAGYVLRRMNVDCSPDASLAGAEYHLWLRNHPSLVDVDNLGIAPGYVAPNNMMKP